MQSTPSERPGIAQRLMVGVATLLTGLASLLASPIVAIHFAWSDWRLRRAIRAAWGADGPRVLVRRETMAWDEILQTRWLPTHASRTTVLGHEYPARGSSEWATLEWRVYHRWRPDFKFTRPPIALVVYPDGRVERVAFGDAIRAKAAGDPSMLERALARLEALVAG